MPKKGLVVIICMLLTVDMLAAGPTAEIADGFQTAQTVKSDYFTIFIEEGVDTFSLTTAVSVPPQIKGIIKSPINSYKDLTLQNQFDLLCLAVSEIMNIPLTKFNCKIKLCRNNEHLLEIARRLFMTESIPKVPAFYVSALNTLYIDSEHANISVLGHELSHAIQSHYFIVEPPPRLQEVLAGFVEYQLRKYTNTLPNK